MSDPRYIDPINDPRPRVPPRDPADPRLDVPGEVRDGSMWSWIIGVIAVIVVAFLVYDYTRPATDTAANRPAVSAPSTTGAAPPPLAARPDPTPATPATPAPAAPAAPK
jgi:hypothetical protein